MGPYFRKWPDFYRVYHLTIWKLNCEENLMFFKVICPTVHRNLKCIACDFLLLYKNKRPMDSYHLPKTIFLILLFLRSIILWKIAYSKAVIWFMAAKKPLLIPFNTTKWNHIMLNHKDCLWLPRYHL